MWSYCGHFQQFWSVDHIRNSQSLSNCKSQRMLSFQVFFNSDFKCKTYKRSNWRTCPLFDWSERPSSLCHFLNLYSTYSNLIITCIILASILNYKLRCIHVLLRFKYLIEKSDRINGRGKPTASSLSANGFLLMACPNFQPSHGNPTVISILRQLADRPEMSWKCSWFILWVTGFQPE